MSSYLLAAVIVLAVVNIVLTAGIWLVARKARPEAFDERFGSIEKGLERTERLVREEMARNREETAAHAHRSREETARTLNDISAHLSARLSENTTWQKNLFDVFSAKLDTLIQTNENKMEKIRETVETRLALLQQSAERSAAASREEIAKALKDVSSALLEHLKGQADRQEKQLGLLAATLQTLTDRTSQEVQTLRNVIEAQLKDIQKNNEQKLEEMRKTVDEKLHDTLERRLGESFQQVSERLESVYKSLGEMHTLALGVGDLKRVLANIKTRGGWGEVQLGTLLEQLLSPDQYEANVAPIPNRDQRVEFAIKLPGKNEGAPPVWLPIDAKFPLEDYQRLLEAQDAADLPRIEEAARALERRVRLQARDICEKYICEPYTTNFAILFLPVEGLYAEVLRRPGLVDTLQRESRVMVMGPTTLGAILNALQMGFRTLAIEKRSSEVWKVLGAVKTEFGKFGDILDKVERKLHEASETVSKAQQRTRVMGRRLKDVEELPAEESVKWLGPMEAAAADIETAAAELVEEEPAPDSPPKT
ncbi:MAG: DNA recombination protein RmuC [Candidatus Sumerlaeia bacterium]|nr:DNA recombination protein RmuC [Candidatus Sumerlaeia bacterium]